MMRWRRDRAVRYRCLVIVCCCGRQERKEVGVRGDNGHAGALNSFVAGFLFWCGFLLGRAQGIHTYERRTNAVKSVGIILDVVDSIKVKVSPEH